MSTGSSSKGLLSPIEDPERLISQRNQGEPSLLFDLEENNMNSNDNHRPPPMVSNPIGPPPVGHIPIPSPIPQNPPNLQNPDPDLRTMEELCQLTMNGL
ncbi:hypothetical protein Tco_0786034 [Tanacetum coccineum]